MPWEALEACRKVETLEVAKNTAMLQCFAVLLFSCASVMAHDCSWHMSDKEQARRLPETPTTNHTWPNGSIPSSDVRCPSDRAICGVNFQGLVTQRKLLSLEIIRTYHRNPLIMIVTEDKSANSSNAPVPRSDWGSSY